MQRGDRAEWQRSPMTVEPGQPGHRYMVLDVSARTDYFVEANGVRSDLFRLDVVDVPYVARIDLEYRFPEYTGLAPQPVEDAGDVAALRGTRVQLRVTTTVPVPSGQLVVEGEPPRALELVADGTLGGSFEVTRDAFYRIELPSTDGRLQTGSPDYAIDVLDDQPPLIRMLKPGRDAQVTSIEEVFTEVEAEDDFGVAKLELVYSIGGAPEKTVALHGGRPLKQLSAGHTFFLEEHALEPGDFISYFARATDNRSAPGRQQSTTDIYFMEVRPFDRDYRQAAEGGGAAAGGGAGDTLSRQQRQIVAATFKLRRDRARSEPRQLEQDVATLALVQGRLRDQVANLNRRMLSRGVAGTGSKLGDTAESLQQAVVEMGAAVRSWRRGGWIPRLLPSSGRSSTCSGRRPRSATCRWPSAREVADRVAPRAPTTCRISSSWSSTSSRTSTRRCSAGRASSSTRPSTRRCNAFASWRAARSRRSSASAGAPPARPAGRAQRAADSSGDWPRRRTSWAAASSVSPATTRRPDSRKRRIA